MGLFDGGGDAGGLMGMYANPQIAGLLGMSQGLLSAAGPSRLPVTMGQAMGAGMQGMQQNTGNALQMQMQMAKMQAMMNPFGPPSGGQGAPAQPQQPQQPNPAMAQGAPVSGAANVGPMSGLSAGMGGLMQPQPQAQPQGAASSAPTDPFSAMFGGHTPQEVMMAGARAAALGNPAGTEMMKMAAQYDPSLQAMLPTDITKMGRQGGMSDADIQAANRAGVTKANYIAPVRAAPGGALAMPDGSMRYTLPAPQAGGMWATNPDGSLIRDGSGQPYQIGVGGASSIAGGMAAAQEGGKGSVLPFTEGKDANGNPLPITNRTQASTGQMPLPLRNNNPGAVSPGGQVAQYPDLQTGLQAMDQNLANYAGKPDTGTLGQVITKWVGSPPNAPAYIKDVTARLGIGANTPVDLTNPAQRQAIATAIMLHENGPGAVFRPGQNAGGAAPASGGGAIYAAPPMGAANAANASQGAPSKQMADSYSSLSNSDSSYQQSREALQEMINLAHNKGAAGAVVGVLPASVGTKISPDAATYQKLHATYVALQGKALGSGGTDASRATIDEAVPTYDKPQSAMVGGLTTQLNNLDLGHIKTQFLTPIYQQGNEKAYTQQSAAFDQNIKPSMVQALTLSGDAQRAAVQAAVKANPSLRSNFEWAFNNGLLK
jgi:hypothetical protein